MWLRAFLPHDLKTVPKHFHAIKFWLSIFFFFNVALFLKYEQFFHEQLPEFYKRVFKNSFRLELDGDYFKGEKSRRMDTI